MHFWLCCRVSAHSVRLYMSAFTAASLLISHVGAILIFFWAYFCTLCTHTKKNHFNFEMIKFKLLCRLKWAVLKSVVRVVLFFRHGARTFKWRLKTTAVSGRAQQHITQACFVLHLFVVLTSFLSLWHPVQELWGPRLNNSNTLPTKLWENLMLQNKHLAVSYDWWSSPV